MIAILQNAGGPLSASQIYQKLLETRGVNQHFQIHPVPPLIRVGPARWGLNDRDVAIKLCDQPKLFDMIARSLEKRGTGIHISELRGRLPDIPGLTAETVFCLSSIDPRLRVSPGQYLHLAEWDGPRRETVAEAVRGVFNETAEPLFFSEIVERVHSRIGRKCERAAISNTLANLQATIDGEGRWHGPKENVGEQDEPDLIWADTSVGNCPPSASPLLPQDVSDDISLIR